jgi:hypothetical protein
VTAKHRLKVLSDIDRVLAAEGLTWADIAAALQAPSESWIEIKAVAVLDMIERILGFPDMLSDNAQSFLKQTGERALRQDVVHLSARQAAWLDALHNKAEAAEADGVTIKQEIRPKHYLVH